MSFSSLNYFHIYLYKDSCSTRCIMEPIEYDVVEFFLQGGVGWVVVAPNFGTCFRQKKSQVWRRYPPFRNFILTKKIKVVSSTSKTVVDCVFHGFGQLWILSQSPWALMWCRLSSSCRQDQISAFDLPAIQRLPPGYIARPLKTRQ